MSNSSANLMNQSLSVISDSIIDLYEIDFSNLQSNFDLLSGVYGVNFGAEPVYRFTPVSNEGNPIYWQNKAYQSLPMLAEGFESKSDGRLPRPMITLANPHGLFSKIAHSNEDFANCKVTRKRTFVRFLDNKNFVNETNPYNSSDTNAHFPDDVYYIGRKTEESREAIRFELVSSLELENTLVPARVVLSGYCGFTYRCSVGCGYKGLPIETSNGKSLRSNFSYKMPLVEDKYNVGYIDPGLYPDGILSSEVKEWSRFGRNHDSSNPVGYELNDIVKIFPTKSSNPYNSTPQVFVCIQSHDAPAKFHPFFSQEYWLKDECQKTLEACKKRFSVHNRDENLKLYNQANSETLLKFGGFPGTDKFDVGTD